MPSWRDRSPSGRQCSSCRQAREAPSVTGRSSDSRQRGDTRPSQPRADANRGALERARLRLHRLLFQDREDRPGTTLCAPSGATRFSAPRPRTRTRSPRTRSPHRWLPSAPARAPCGRSDALRRLRCRRAPGGCPRYPQRWPAWRLRLSQVAGPGSAEASLFPRSVAREEDNWSVLVSWTQRLLPHCPTLCTHRLYLVEISSRKEVKVRVTGASSLDWFHHGSN